jgi:hypothetical protein
MKILVIELEYADPSVLFEDDQLVNLRYLMTLGCWGTVEANQDAPWPAFADHLPAHDYAHVILRRVPDVPDYYRELDERIGSHLESITGETIVLVVCIKADRAPGCFVLAAPNSALNGRLEGVRLADIAATLLVLGGFPPLPDNQGVSLALPTEPGNKVDDEEMIRERLRGLGYIA